MARRLCRLPRLFPLTASAYDAPTPHLLPVAINPSPAPLLPYFSSPTRALPALCHVFSTAGGSGMVVVGSAESFSSILWKVQGRAIAPVISKLSDKYPNIPVYKVDIDLDGLGCKLGPLKIFSVPTFHFYHKGEKASEVVGADVKQLEAAMENLHKQQ